MWRLPRSEAFRIEYWALEEAKLQRMPPEAEFSRKIVMVVGGGSGIGREVALLLARKGAHLVVADMNEASRERCRGRSGEVASAEAVPHSSVDFDRPPRLGGGGKAHDSAVRRYRRNCQYSRDFSGGRLGGQLTEAQWSMTFLVNVTGNFSAGAGVRLGVRRSEAARCALC